MLALGLSFYLRAFADERQAGVDESLKEVIDDLLVSLTEGGSQAGQPGLDQGAPPQGLRLHVDHATARHLRGRGTTGNNKFYNTCCISVTDSDLRKIVK